MKTTLSNSSIVRQLTIAALLGTFPSISSAQTTATPHDTSSPVSGGAGSNSSEKSAERIPVATHDIPRGTMLTAADIGYAPRKPRTQHPVPHSVDTVDGTVQPAMASDRLIGWTTRRIIRAGDWLGTPSIIPPQLVKSGDTVEVSWNEGGVRVTSKGLATRSAGMGERVTVRLPAQRFVDASVVAPGQVRVN